ncbi:hypothetical protein U0035_13925 [Niabella yanshanensis]|uniref:Uncharacterized protein n=1 Tax=Niabella yanshanensis TaxID=577386 RepID=A0ABZ0W117_9BACT|nr:hypothetical protein [Niabella yanshanensis]WQD36766.1 hypothetical protein U0035_13925 [Niabella yanshanensis]
MAKDINWRLILKRFFLNKSKTPALLAGVINIFFVLTGAVVTVGAVAVADVEAMEDDALLHCNAFLQALYDTGCALHNNALTSGDV